MKALSSSLVCVALVVVASAASALVPEPALLHRPEQAAVPGAATLAQALEFAENAFVYGDYENVVSILEPFLFENAPADASPATLSRAYTLLGTSAHFEQLGPSPEQMDTIANRAFLELLILDPLARLDPLVFPPRVIARLEEVRSANAELLDSLIEESPADGILYVEKEVRTQPRIVSMLPFGIGFFAQGRLGAGLGYSLPQFALAGSMIGLYLANEADRGRDGYVDDSQRARRRATAQVTSASLFTVLVIANILHGALTHDTQGQVGYRTLPELPREFQEESSLRPRDRWRFSFVPLVELPVPQGSPGVPPSISPGLRY